MTKYEVVQLTNPWRVQNPPRVEMIEEIDVVKKVLTVVPVEVLILSLQK